MADACGELRQTLITRIEGMIHDVQRELHANNVEHETLDGLCFRGEQLARQVARLVTANVLDSSVLNRPFYSCVLSYLAMNASEVGVELALIQTSLFFSCKCKLVSIRTT